MALALATIARTSKAQDLPEVFPRPVPPANSSGFAPRPPLLVPAPARPPAQDPIAGLGDPIATVNVKVGQGRFLTLKDDLDAVAGRPAPFIAVGDPSVLDFFPIDKRHIRLIGKKLGTTDLAITTALGQSYNFEVQVVADLDLLRVQLQKSFPDASIRLSQVREKVILEGEARDSNQVARIVATVEAFVRSIQSVQVLGQVGNSAQRVAQIGADPNAAPPGVSPDGMGSSGGPVPGTGLAGGLPPLPGAPNSAFGPTGAPVSPGAIATNSIATGASPVINLLRVPTSQQVLLKVRIAELNRTAFRQIGADFLGSVPGSKTLFGSQIAGNGFAGAGGAATLGASTFNSTTVNRDLAVSSQATLFGTFSNGAFITVIDALRRNNLLKILAEPNLVALNGHQANFLAGGQFPVPVLQGGAGGLGGNGGISVQFKDYGVRLAFLPIIQDGETIRLTVDPEVSTIDTTLGTTLVPGGTPVPALNSRSAHTTVELKQGETLAIAGLLQLTLEGQTQRLPGLGDLPYIGAFFSNTTNSRVEKELVVMVTPYIVEPMAPGQVPAGPGDEVREPNDLEFYFLQRIEGRTAIDKRSTTSYDDPLHVIRHSIVEKKYLIGPSGYSK